MFLNSRKLSRSSLFAALLITLTTTYLISSKTLANEQPDELAQAKELLDSWSGQTERLRDAKVLIDTALNKNSENVYALKELARYHIMDGYKYGNVFETGTFENAEKILLKTIEINPSFDGSYVLLGHVYENMNDLVRAEEALKEAETLGSNDPWLHLNWAAVLKKQGKTEEMTFRYKMVIDSGTDNLKALSNAYSYLRKDSENSGDFASVEEYYQKLFELRPDDAWSRGNYADFLRNKVGDFDKSIEYARKALEMMNFGVGRRILGLSLYAKWGDLLANGSSAEEANVFFQEGLEYYSNLEGSFARLGEYDITFPTAKYLVGMGVSVNGTTNKGYTALSAAAYDGKTSLSLKLLKLGVDPNITTNNRYTALSLAIYYGHTETALALLEHRNTNSKTSLSTIRNALSVAKRKKNTRMIEEINKILQ